MDILVVFLFFLLSFAFLYCLIRFVKWAWNKK